MILDTNTPFGARVARRLNEDLIIWLVTVDPQQVPQPVPIWFDWDGKTFLVYSKPNTFKLRNIAYNPQVALHLDGDRQGGDIVVFVGEAWIDPDAPPADTVETFVTRYTQGFRRIGTTPAGFAHTYSVAIRIRPRKLRGH